MVSIVKVNNNLNYTNHALNINNNLNYTNHALNINLYLLTSY
jgi:hypothetical protein